MPKWRSGILVVFLICCGTGDTTAFDITGSSRCTALSRQYSARYAAASCKTRGCDLRRNVSPSVVSSLAIARFFSRSRKDRIENSSSREPSVEPTVMSPIPSSQNKKFSDGVSVFAFTTFTYFRSSLQFNLIVFNGGTDEIS
jgi:hypothetical protein